MGRHHTIKLPDHLYISPPPPPPPPTSSFASASSFFSSKSALSYTPASVFLQTTSTTRAFERRIPGFKTSAAFLTALRANLDLQFDVSESPINTPDSLRPLVLSSSTSALPPPSPLFQAMSTSNLYPDADLAPPSALNLPKASTVESEQEVEMQEPRDPNAIPELTTFPAKDDIARTEALRLIADSVAQQRQRASRALIFHPITIALLAIAIAGLHKFFYKGELSDYAIIGTTFAGIVMAVLVSIRAASGPYIDEAERVGTWRWLSQGRTVDEEKATGQKVLGERDDEILLTKFGDEFIGAILFRGVQFVDESAASTKKSSRKSSPASQPRTEIRAWTVRQRYRGKGVGAALLEDAIRIAQEKGWTAGGIEVAADHANSKVVLPKVFSGFVLRNNERARVYVEKKARELEATSGGGKGKKKR